MKQSIKLSVAALFLAAVAALFLMQHKAAHGAVSMEGSSGSLLEVILKDPVQPELPARAYPVDLILDEKGFPQLYRMELSTEVCLERICNLLITTIYWDAIGRFSHLEHPEWAPFTKTNHELFSDTDYSKLDSVLRDQTTIIKNYPLSYFVYPKADGVDAVGGATPQTVKDAVVSGAAYTSWVLWHWVNGDVVEQLISNTVRRVGADYWEYCLRSNDPDLIHFSLEKILQKSTADSCYADACYDLLRRTADVGTVQMVMEYFDKALLDPKEVNLRLVSMIGSHPASSRLLLDRFEQIDSLPETLQLKMAEKLPSLSRYSDVHAILRLLERNRSPSEQVRFAAQGLLTNSSSFIVRRAKQFLNQSND